MEARGERRNVVGACKETTDDRGEGGREGGRAVGKSESLST